MGEENILNEAIIVDIAVIPSEFDIDKWLYIARETGICLVDSSKGGHMPYMMNNRKKLTFMIKDIKNETP